MSHLKVKKNGMTAQKAVSSNLSELWIKELFHCVSGYIQILRGYADFMTEGTSYVQAKKLNSGAVQETEHLKLPHPHLAIDVIHQTLFIEQAHVSSLEPKKSKQITLLYWNIGHIRHGEYYTEMYIPSICLAIREVPAITQLGMHKENALHTSLNVCHLFQIQTSVSLNIPSDIWEISKWNGIAESVNCDSYLVEYI